MTGYGVMTYDDGRSYKGEFLNGKFSGKGEYTLKNGEK